jgi:hypothetical protein
VTIDDGWNDTSANRSAIITALQACPVKPTVRIVMDKTQTPGGYASLFQAIHNVAYVMACPVDSDYMLSYKTVDAYRQRFVDSVAALEPYVDLWEIANEINGEGPNAGQGTASDPAWMGNGTTARQFNANKMYAAYSYLHSLGLKTVLTPYEFAPDCGYNGNTPTMEAWLKTYVPADMKAGIDYVMVSYYEDDNFGYQPNWQSVFNSLQTIFPTARLGFGECGNTSDNATTQSKIAMVHRYYQKPKYVPNYVGGYFWWNWVQDCVLNSNASKIRSAMYADMLAQPQ